MDTRPLKDINIKPLEDSGAKPLKDMDDLELEEELISTIKEIGNLGVEWGMATLEECDSIRWWEAILDAEKRERLIRAEMAVRDKVRERQQWYRESVGEGMEW